MKIIIISILISTFHCSPNHQIFVNKGVGNIELGQSLLDSPYNEEELKITKNEKGEVIMIDILSEKFKTKEKLGVGILLTDISEFYKTEVTQSRIDKSGVNIGSLGKGVYLEKTVFLDSDEDGLTDRVIIFQTEN